MEFDAGEIPKKHPISLAGIPIPWQEIPFPWQEVATFLKGSFNIPTKQKKSILSTVEQERTKDISQKSLYVSITTVVFTARKSFSITSIDTL